MSCENRLGKLEIPNGLAGPPGTPGINGAGWASGAGDPVGAPPADIIFWLNTTSGELFKYVSGSWVSQVASIFGTNGNLWLTGTAVPTAPTTEGNFYYRTTTGDIYQYTSGSWGAVISNIKGANGTNGVNGTGLLDSFGSNTLTYNTNASYQSLNGLFSPLNTSFNAFDAFPTTGSIVRSTMFVKARFLTSATSIDNKPNAPELYIKPRIVGTPSFGPYDLNTNAVDQSTIDSSRKLWPPNAVETQPMLGQDAPLDGYGYARVDIPRRGTANNYPYVYIKIVTTLRRSSSNAITSMVEYITTSRYGSYTAVYDPAVAITLSFSPAEAIGIEYIGDILVPTTIPGSCQVTAISHFVEKIIL